MSRAKVELISVRKAVCPLRQESAYSSAASPLSLIVFQKALNDMTLWLKVLRTGIRRTYSTASLDIFSSSFW